MQLNNSPYINKQITNKQSGIGRIVVAIRIQMYIRSRTLSDCNTGELRAQSPAGD